MSSVASQRALIVALGIGVVSIAALFVWYTADVDREKQKNEKKSKKELTNPKTASERLEFAEEIKDNGVLYDSVEKNCPLETKIEDGLFKPRENKAVPQNSSSDSKEGEKLKVMVSPLIDPSESTSIICNETSVVPENGDSVQVQETEKSSDVTDVESQPASSGERSVSDGDYELEDQVVCNNSGELMLDLSNGPVDQEPFSWSEEMERSYLEAVKQEEEAVAASHAAGYNTGYNNSESPGAGSENSEVSSQDSGRATGGLASSLSPMDDMVCDGLPIYEFEIPNSLVGLIIGVKGKTIKELSTRTDVRMLIREHHTPEKHDTHQICQVRGKREQINRCLQMLRRRFPPARFPELNLQPVLPPPLPNNIFDAMTAHPSWLTLPDNIPCEVAASAVIDPGHFFLQQPTHPSFSSLQHLDMYMLRLYSGGSTIPELPKPCATGLLCAAPVLDAWFRAVTVVYHEESDEVLVRFVDYGGYQRVPRSGLRQIRTDLMSLPFQATECYLAYVQPIDGTSNWNEDAYECFSKNCMGKVVNATVVGLHSEDKVPMVSITFEDDSGKSHRLDKSLLELNSAKPADPTKLVRCPSSQAKRPSLNSQTSQVAV